MKDNEPVRPFRGIGRAVLPVRIGCGHEMGRAGPDHDRAGDRLPICGDRSFLHRRGDESDRADVFVPEDPKSVGRESGCFDSEINDRFFRRIECEASLAVGLLRGQRSAVERFRHQPSAPGVDRLRLVDRDRRCRVARAAGVRHPNLQLELLHVSSGRRVRGRGRSPHLLHVRPRSRAADGDPPDPRLGAAGP